MDQAYVVTHYMMGHKDIEAVFNVEADARHYADWYNGQRKGGRREVEEWEVVAVPLNIEAAG